MQLREIAHTRTGDTRLGNLVVSGNLPSETPDAQRMFWLGDE